MLRINGKAFVDACDSLATLEMAIKLDGRNGNTSVAISQETADSLRADLDRLMEELNRLGTNVTLMQAGRLRQFVATTPPTITFESVGNHIEHIRSRLSDELSLTHLYVLPAATMNYFAPSSPPFGSEVQAKYSTANGEIDEAGKCFALGRYTACVFHLMRTMEVAIKAIARCLNISDPVKPAGKNWGAILTSMKAAMDARWRDATAKATPGAKVFESLYVSLDAVKNPWRNATMHVEHTYTQEQAESIYRAVKSFMEILALRCDEQGEPKLP